MGHYTENRIVAVRPNSVVEFVGYKEKEIEVREHFFVRNEYALRLQKLFYPIWFTFHCWDMIIANRLCPQLNLGFDTLTAYPDASTGATTVDGYIGYYSATGVDWTTARNASSGSLLNSSLASDDMMYADAHSTTNKFSRIKRSWFTLDTSSITSVATISATTFSIYVTLKGYSGSVSPNMDIYTSTPASDDNLVEDDYDQIGDTSQTGSPITYASIDTGDYSDFSFNTTGKGNVSKTGITKLGIRNANYDVANSAPTWSSGMYYYVQGNFSDNGTNKPKLVVTYTLPATFSPQLMMCS
jgi:hypothetical protein